MDSLHSPVICAILDSNDPPDELEAGFIRDLLSAAHMQRGHLDAEIGTTPFREDFISERDALDQRISYYEGALSTLRHIPAEILCIIFDLALLRVLERYPSRGQDLWAISHVCSRWRAILFSQPALWAAVSLNLDSSSKENSYRLEAQLQRSAQLPLQVSVSCGSLDEPSSRETLLLNMLVEHCLRWETFALSFQVEWPEWNLHLLRGRLPLLRELNLWRDLPSTTDWQTDVDSYDWDYFHNAPNLRDVSINEGSTSYTLWVELPLPQLLRYRGTGTWYESLDILASASNLVDCALGVHSINSPSGPRIPLPHLRRLAVGNSIFLQCITAPALEELHCAGPISRIVGFLKATPSCQLQTLFLHKCGAVWDPPDFAPLLRALPALAEIGVQFADRDHAHQLFSLLTILPADDAGDLPPLRSIAICLNQLRSGSDLDLLRGPLKNMIESRWRAGRLRTVMVATDLEHSSSWVGRLRGEGLKIALYPKTYNTLLTDMTSPHLQVQYVP
ncbi:hypothetical protein FB451DRAFT_1263627 [Mycena latifolia]|nr:hypothetical protein FB451DRAFT_1263627 [Mycena latifolia]